MAQLSRMDAAPRDSRGLVGNAASARILRLWIGGCEGSVCFGDGSPRLHGERNIPLHLSQICTSLPQKIDSHDEAVLLLNGHFHSLQLRDIHRGKWPLLL